MFDQLFGKLSVVVHHNCCGSEYLMASRSD
jgi:hypothetical protein